MVCRLAQPAGHSARVSARALSQYRRPKFLEHNDYWMGYDGYGLGSNAATTEARNTPGKLWSDGINDNANTGDNVAGGIATLLWNLGPKYFAQALAAQTAEQFYASLASDASVDAAFIDQGLAVTDDPLEPNDIMSSATVLPIGTTLRDGLILAETEAGRGDWYRISIPAVGVAKTYALTTRVRFNGKQGDLDLVVRSADGKLVATDVRRGGDSALIHLTGLDGKKSYTFLIGVFGHGASPKFRRPKRVGRRLQPVLHAADQLSGAHPALQAHSLDVHHLVQFLGPQREGWPVRRGREQVHPQRCGAAIHGLLRK